MAPGAPAPGVRSSGESPATPWRLSSGLGLSQGMSGLNSARGTQYRVPLTLTSYLPGFTSDARCRLAGTPLRLQSFTCLVFCPGRV